jgi:hypothetical protein
MMVFCEYTDRFLDTPEIFRAVCWIRALPWLALLLQRCQSYITSLLVVSCDVICI